MGRIARASDGTTNAANPGEGWWVRWAWRGFTVGLWCKKRRDCKESLPLRQAPATIAPTRLPDSRLPVPNITLVRRQNALALFQQYAEKALAGGAAPKGLEQAFAATLQVSPSMWSQIKSARPIGDKLARQIEQHCDKPIGWLDEERVEDGPSVVEQQFLELALKAWRTTNAAGRKALREHVRRIAG